MMRRLPEQFVKNMKALLGEEFEAFWESFNKDSFSGLRINGMKISPKEFYDKQLFDLNPVPWTKDGFYYVKGSAEERIPSAHPYYYAGLYYIQEPSAMAPAGILPVEKGDRVLDMCAAPGGKTTELASKLSGTGVLVSNDISPSRVKALQKNIEVFGIKNAVVLSENPARLVPVFREYFDKILIDAPCSGEGMFRKKPAVANYWEEHGPDYYSAIQKEIILYGADMLRPGGKMLFSTCTFSPLEDEGTIQYLLDNRPEMRVIPIPQYEGFSGGRPEWTEHGSESLKQCVRIWPHRAKGEGHFLALLQKAEGDCIPCETARRTDTNRLPEDADAFLSQLIGWDRNRFRVKRDIVSYRPEELPDLPGLRVSREGLFAGVMKKNRFEPTQALAMALKPEEYPRVVDLGSTDPNVIRYLKCETLDVPTKEKGWYLICTDGYPLGWGKSDGNRIKNKYNPNWRMM
ncbi:RsmB/NOP family class I SAM-dependent RNA methyltransferase [Anaerolentibacter hominis]|uniref:RsmB/NOP family class I SAM-dependent RNA methyltransferase n=1 Tax=Anaerolentibacter hominis TaxID=3079009 RepID=UPI0031B81E62